MPLTSGARLGAYEIGSPIGSGGMGEVYRARDTKLNRAVAIKVLPAELGGRPDALARFEREARAVAALSHSNILAIHDFGSESGTVYAVMELLEGETLRTALTAGPLSPRRAVDYAIQIARGLAAAHDKGIVHRDLKPENVFVTNDGRVKILDFGLARHEATPLTAATIVPTISSPTEPGTVLGTVGYMAPEQVRGDAADWRADIFAFGAVLYEMVTGTRAFHQETAAETMTAILRHDVPEFAAALAVPAALDRIIRHCLEKKPEARFRSAHDLAFALEAVGGSSSVSSAGHQAVIAAEPTRTPRWTWMAIAAVAAVVVAAIAGAWIGRRASSAPATATASPPVFRQLTFRRGSIGGARFAPDGRTIVYSASWDGGDSRLYLTRPESPGATPLALPAAVLFAVSSDAEMAIGVNVVDRGPSTPPETTLMRAPLLGGSGRPVVDHVTFADSSQAGLAVVVIAGSRQRLEFPPGRVLFETDGEIGYPRVSPDGTRVAFLDWPVKADDRGTVVVIDRDGTKRTISQAWEGIRGLAWRPDGREVWYTAAHAGVQYAIQGSASSPSAERLIYAAPGGVLLQDISRDGNVVITRYDRSMQIEASLKDGDARGISWLDFQWARDITPDSRRILVTYSGQGSSPNYDVYVHTVGESDGTRIGEGQPQQFSPDGASVLAVVHGPPAKLMILPVGAGEPRTVTTAGVTVTQARWLPDGRHLLIIGTEQGKGVRAYVTDVSGAVPRAFTPEGITFRADQVALSPEGGRVAFRAPDRTVVIYSIDGGASSPAKGLSPEEMPVGWTGDGRSLLLLERKPERRLVAVDPVTGRRAVYKTLTASDAALNGPSQIHLTRDGRSYVANYGRSQDTLFLVEGLK